jgi:hypothetical protein
MSAFLYLGFMPGRLYPSIAPAHVSVLSICTPAVVARPGDARARAGRQGRKGEGVAVDAAADAGGHRAGAVHSSRRAGRVPGRPNSAQGLDDSHVCDVCASHPERQMGRGALHTQGRQGAHLPTSSRALCLSVCLSVRKRTMFSFSPGPLARSASCSASHVLPQSHECALVCRPGSFSSVWRSSSHLRRFARVTSLPRLRRR